MEKYRAFVQYHFKKGMEEQGLKFLEMELLRHAQEMGCHSIQLWQDEKDPSFVIGTGDWNSFDEAKKFQAHWDKKEKELIRFCTNTPKRQLFKIRGSWAEKSKKVA